MEYKKVAFIRNGPLTKYLYESLEIEKILNEGFEVDYIDITALYIGKIEHGEDFVFKSIITISTWKDFKRYLEIQNTSQILFIYQTLYNYRSLGVFYLLRKYNCKLGFFARYALPSTKIQTTFQQKLDGFKRKLKNRVGLRISYYGKKLGMIKTYDYIFAGGKKSLDHFFKGYYYRIDRNSAKVINVNAFDFDRFLKMERKERVVNGTYIVFLDQYLPYHSDFLIHEKRTIESESYFFNLNTFFSQIEKKFETKIVIAAHPKANNYKKHNPFDKRPVFFERTAELVAGSMLVLAHYTTSINFAVLFNKPIILLSSIQIKKVLPAGAQFQDRLAKTLGSMILDIGDNITDEIKITFDSFKYSEYKYNYLTSPESEHKQSVTIFIEFLKNVSIH